MPWPTDEEVKQDHELPGWMKAAGVILVLGFLTYHGIHDSPERHAARNCAISYRNARNRADSIATDGAHMPIGGGPYIYVKTCAELRAAGKL